MRRFSSTICYHIIFLATLLTVGCAAGRVDHLNKRIDAYWRAMRWRAPEALSQYVEPPHRERYLGRVAGKLQNMRLVEHELLNVTFDKDKKNAFCRVVYSYYTLKDNELLSAQEMQHWRYHEKDGWQLKVEDRVSSDDNDRPVE